MQTKSGLSGTAYFAFIPFIVIADFIVFEESPIIAKWIALAGLLFFFWIKLRYSAIDFLCQQSPISRKFLLAVCACCVVSCYVNWSRPILLPLAKIVLTLVFLTPFFLQLMNSKDRENIKYLSFGLLAAVCYTCSFQDFGETTRTAEFLGVALIVLFFMMTRVKNIQTLKILPLVLLALLISWKLFKTGARGPFIATLMAIFTGLAVRRQSYKVVLLGLCLASFLFTGISSFRALNLKLILSPEAQHSLKARNVSFRIVRWANTIKMIQNSPWFGHGLGSYEFAYVPFSRAVAPDLELRRDQTITSAHNSYLTAAAQVGVPALILAFFLLMGIGRNCWLNVGNRDYALLSLMFLVFLTLDGITSFPFEGVVGNGVLAFVAAEVASSRKALPLTDGAGVLRILKKCSLSFTGAMLNLVEIAA